MQIYTSTMLRKNTRGSLLHQAKGPYSPMSCISRWPHQMLLGAHVTTRYLSPDPPPLHLAFGGPFLLSVEIVHPHHGLSPAMDFSSRNLSHTLLKASRPDAINHILWQGVPQTNHTLGQEMFDLVHSHSLHTPLWLSLIHI